MAVQYLVWFTLLPNGVSMLTEEFSLLVFKPKLDAYDDEINERDASVANKTLIFVKQRMRIAFIIV